MSEAPLLLKGVRALVSCDAAATVHRDVDLLCEGGVISRIGSISAADIPPAAEVVDARHLLVYPGLINTHHHFFQAFVRNQEALDWSQLNLVQWLERIYKIFTLVDEDCIYHSSLVSMAELLKYGCTTAFDHQYCFNRHAGTFLVDRQFEAAAQLGIRLVAGRGTNTLPQDEGSTMPAEMVETTDAFLRDCERLIDRYHDPAPHAMRSVVVAPCQPVNCRPETFVEAMALARAKGVYLHTHLSEGENAVMLERWGQRSLAWCEDRGICGADVWYAHGWEMTAEEFARMGAAGTGLSHCAPAMCLVGDGITDLAAAWAAGVPVGLGVDGQASNDNSNLLECVRLAYLLQCLGARRRQHPMPPAQAFLGFATTGGARLLGRPELGCLQEGAAADLFAIDCRDVDFAGALHDPALLPVKLGVSKPVDLTVVAGKVVWRHGEFSGIDEHRVAAEADTVYRRVILESSVVRRLRGEAG